MSRGIFRQVWGCRGKQPVRRCLYADLRQVREEAVVRAAAQVLNPLEALNVLPILARLAHDDAGVHVRGVRRVLWLGCDMSEASAQGRISSGGQPFVLMLM